MIVVAALGAVLAFLHLVGRVAHLGPGGLKLPAPGTWMGYRDSLGATLMLSAEQFAGLLGVWVTCLALCVALFARDLGRFGNPQVRSAWREIVEGTALVLFGVVVAILGLLSAIFLRDERMMLVEVPMPALALPGMIFGASALVAGVLRLMNTLKALPTTPPQPSGGKTAAPPTASTSKTPSAPRTASAANAKTRNKTGAKVKSTTASSPGKVARVTAAQAGKIAGSASRKPSAGGTRKGGR